MAHQTIAILEKQRQDLVVRVLKKHEEMEAGRLLTERILAGISEFFLLLDKDFYVIQANREFFQRSGYPERGSSRLCLKQLFGLEQSATIQEALQAKEFGEQEAVMRIESGESLPVKLRGSSHVTPNGRVLHMLLCSDCSDFYQLMERIQEGQKQLMHSSRLASLGEMTAGIGHELTQPLNAILLFARNGLKALDSPGDHASMLRENLEMIIDRSTRAAAIITTMRNFGRKVEGEQAPVDLNAMLRKIQSFIEPQLRLSEIALDLNLTPHACTVLGVEVRLEQVVLNLVQNAIQAMGQVAHPRLSISTQLGERLNLHTMRSEAFALMSLVDNGEGIAPELQKNIFDPFFTTRTVGAGMGLGLCIVERIIREFSGYIEVESTPGQGALFRVCLPLYTDKGPEMRTETLARREKP